MMLAVILVASRRRTYLSLNAFNILSTSSSRWNAFASRFSNFSMSMSAGVAEDEDEPGSGMMI